MQVSDALSCLGTKRTIWIDDLFNDTPAELAKLLLENWEVAVSCNFDELNDLLARAEFGAETVRVELVERLTELGSDRNTAIKEAFFAHEAMKPVFASRELQGSVVGKICKLLSIREEDCWTFDKAGTELAELCSNDDSEIIYMVDLNEAGVSETRGIDILKQLWNEKSKGTAFILTHEAAATEEAQKEGELRRLLLQDGNPGFGIPICVIAKERFSDADDQLETNLKVSIKRAGLRKSLSEVVVRAEGTIAKAFGHAADGLLSIPPEQLEAHVFERGYKEGVSELHVVERILTSQISQELRRFFGTDQDVLSSTKRLRTLRRIELSPREAKPDENLAAFRLAEVWETDELINAALAPIACGDVFESDPHEFPGQRPDKKFILLAQPCDIALRPAGKSRAQETAFFVPLVRVDGPLESEKSAKQPLLPCTLDDAHWMCEFRQATSVRTAVLDLASFRADGRVRIDEGQAASEDLLDAQKNIFKKRSSASNNLFKTSDSKPSDAKVVDVALQLSFSADSPFSQFYRGILCPKNGRNLQADIPALPRRVTWRLRRCGRVRMPYSIALLDQYLSIMSRQAFDLDYMSPGFEDGRQIQQGAPPAASATS